MDVRASTRVVLCVLAVLMTVQPAAAQPDPDPPAPWVVITSPGAGSAPIIAGSQMTVTADFDPPQGTTVGAVRVRIFHLDGADDPICQLFAQTYPPPAAP